MARLVRAFAVLGAVGMALLGRPTDDDGGLRRPLHWGALALYGAVAVVAVFADRAAAVVGVSALQVEAVLLSLLLFVGLNLAFVLLFTRMPSEPDGRRDR